MEQCPPDDRLLEDHPNRAPPTSRRGIREVVVLHLIAVHCGDDQGGRRHDLQLAQRRIPHIELQIGIDDQIVVLDPDNHAGGHLIGRHDRIDEEDQTIPTASVGVEECFALRDGSDRRIQGLDARKGGGIHLCQADRLLHHQLQGTVGPHGQIAAGPDLSGRLDGRDLHLRWQAAYGRLREDVQTVLTILGSA